jgi:hypothetical protein
MGPDIANTHPLAPATQFADTDTHGPFLRPVGASHAFHLAVLVLRFGASSLGSGKASPIRSTDL